MNAPIPEDLQVWYGVACDGISFKTDHRVVKVLIERIAALEAQLADAKDNLRQMTDCRDDLNRLVSQREAQWKQERDQLRAENAVLKERIKTAINAACERCKRGDALFMEPSTGFYTHTLGGNYCSAHRYHNLLGSEAADAARGKP